MDKSLQPVTYSAGKNIAIKVPDHEYDQTVRFYRDVLGFPEKSELSQNAENTALIFGNNILWIDRVTTLSQAEIWLEIKTDNVAGAKASLEQEGYKIRDSLEALPDELDGFWLAGPSNIINLVN